jgi:hypothetical protein
MRLWDNPSGKGHCIKVVSDLYDALHFGLDNSNTTLL